MIPAEIPLCFTCERFVKELFNWHCEAFPEGIPDEIIFSSVDHRSPVEGDHGLQYVPKEGVVETEADG